MANTKADCGFGLAADNRQYVTFNLNEEEYALDARNVQEIIELPAFTRIPHLPEFLRGVINLRGTILPVVDMKLKLNMSSHEYKRHTCVIVTEFSGGVMGLIVDAVSDVTDIAAGDVSSTPSFGSRIKTDFISGMGKIDSRLLIILDIEKILTCDEMIAVSDINNNEFSNTQRGEKA